MLKNFFIVPVVYWAKRQNDTTELLFDIFNYAKRFVFWHIIHFCDNGKKFNIIGYEVEAIDTESIECIQYGFKIILNSGKTLAFLGDVPCSKNVYSKIENSDWVLHEAMCLEKDKYKVKPHEKNHSTVKDVSIAMNTLNIKNLLLWHCIDNNIETRKELFTKEAKEYFNGNVYVPNDLDEIEL